jgi:4-amino-4-deoxy-L-arabinose transferase-like glycosyltransferase
MSGLSGATSSKAAAPRQIDVAARRRTVLLLTLITAAAAAVRFYGLDWGAPYYHFHIDEHFVFLGALAIRQDFLAAADSPKFFMYSPLPMYALIGMTEAYERLGHPLNLALKNDGIIFMVLGRSISATLGTATIPLVYAIAAQVSGRAAGLVAATLAAAGVLHLRDSHFFSVDVSLTFFSVLAWLFMVRIVRRGTTGAYLATGVATGAALACKYSAAFLLPITLVAHLCAPDRPLRTAPWREWIRWLVRGTIPGVIAGLTFLLLDPYVWLDFDKFVAGVRELVTGPMSGEVVAIWGAQFTDVQPRMFWFTNILWWGLGPAFEIWALLGIAWLVWRRDRMAVIVAAFPVIYYIVAGRTILPFARYAVPLVPSLAVVAGVFSADLFRQRPPWRRVGLLATSLVVVSTVLYAAAYMNVFIKPDSRLTASDYLRRRVPEGASVLVEPSHNTPPMGAYLANPNFDEDYVLWGQESERHDYYHLISLDTYRFLYDRRPSPQEKREYIERRLAMADYIVMDDTYLQFYAHLPDKEHGVVKQYYEDLFAGRLGFRLLRSFKVYPRLGGIDINDDAAELTFRLFDHPRVFVFVRDAPRG